MDAFVATTRFGLGAARDERVAVASDPRGWLLAQLEGPDPIVEKILASRVPSTHTVATVAGTGDSKSERRELVQATKAQWLDDSAVHLQAAASSTMPFRERLVAFWANHFTVSVARKEVMGVAAGFERDVVRANLDGPFADMLLASTTHPAMLAYLDNLQSMGPGSRAGQRKVRGLNENLARELLELHTLGVSGGYDQGDVRSLAMILTGWSLETGGGRADMMAMAMGDEPTFTGAFGFQTGRHEPGPKELLGKSYAEGFDAGKQALADLAVHPSTAHHVATGLVRHFVADQPPSQAVDVVAEAFTKSKGHLPTVHAALVGLKQAWAPLTKLKSPRDLVLSTARGLGFANEGVVMRDALHALGQPPYQAPSPKGWADVGDAWTGPEQVLARVAWLQQVADHVDGSGSAWAEELLGPALSADTRAVLADDDNLWVLLCSPEFQRR